MALTNQFYLISTNFGPYTDERWRLDFRKLFAKCKDVCFRDHNSYELFKELPNVRYAPDAVFSFGRIMSSNMDKTIIVSVINCSMPGRPEWLKKCSNKYESKGMCICKDKSKIDIDLVKKELNEGLKEKYFLMGREWPYKNVRPKILGEKYMVDESGNDLKDYKVLCFNGVPKLIELHMGRFTDHQTQDFYDVNWNKTSISQTGLAEFKINKDVFPRPENLDEMLSLSRELSKGLAHIRVDWYSIHGKLYFGELTFYDGSGLDPWDNPEDDKMMGDWIDLSLVKK